MAAPPFAVPCLSCPGLNNSSLLTIPIRPAIPLPLLHCKYAPQVVPVYTRRDENDYIIRSYTKCPAYDDMLAAWYNSSEFQAMSAQSTPVRGAVSTLYPSTDTSLINWCVWGGSLGPALPMGRRTAGQVPQPARGLYATPLVRSTSLLLV